MPSTKDIEKEAVWLKTIGEYVDSKEDPKLSDESAQNQTDAILSMVGGLITETPGIVVVSRPLASNMGEETVYRRASLPDVQGFRIELFHGIGVRPDGRESPGSEIVSVVRTSYDGQDNLDTAPAFTETLEAKRSPRGIRILSYENTVSLPGESDKTFTRVSTKDSAVSGRTAVNKVLLN